MAARPDATIETDGRPIAPGVGSILAWACWLGLGSGAAELVVFLLKCRVLDPRNLNVGRQMVWMFPVAGWMVVGGAGLALAAGSRLWPRFFRTRTVLFVLADLAVVGVLFRAPVYTAVCLILASGLAWRASSSLTKFVGRFDRPLRIGACLPIGLLGIAMVAGMDRGAGTASRGHSESEVEAGRKNVILIVLDTLRADRLGVYGYPRDTSPNLSRLASRGVRFERAFSTAPWTGPSHAGIFTGRWPHELSIGWDRPLDSKDPTLAEALTLEGYSTAGFVANTTYCSYETGLDRGFAHYEDYDVTVRGTLLCSSVVERTLNFFHKHPDLAARFGLRDSDAGDRKDASRINRDFLSWVDARNEANRPFFAFLNYYDAHHPYLAPETEADARFGRKPESPRDFRLLKTWWERDKAGLRPDDLALALDSYDRCIAYLDDQLGRLFAELSRRGQLDNSVVIVTSDHGEHLGERQLFGHGCSVYRPELQVPLLIVAPGLCPEGKTVERPVSLRDLPSTILDLLGSPERSRFPGRSLVRTWREGMNGEDSADLVVSELDSPPEDDPNRGRSPGLRGPMVSIIDGRHHYIRGGDGLEELFDLRLDPGEQADLAGRPESAADLERFRAGAGKPPQPRGSSLARSSQ